MCDSDRNFDNLAERLKRNIYSSDKGLVRLTVLKNDMLNSIHELSHNQPLEILDAGGGMGQIARWLAEKGHEIVLCDLSAEMLEIAAEENKKAGLESRIRLLHAPLQDLPQLLPNRKFDIIILHGVIEWMKNPDDALLTLGQLLKPGGCISLLFFNRNKLVLKWGINGQNHKAISGKPKNSRPLTPQCPLVEADLSETLARIGLRITAKSRDQNFLRFFFEADAKNLSRRCHN
jgi:S-adenosylmethionine-dependent methyltransferase